MKIINRRGVEFYLLPQWARWMKTSCCHYRVWIQWGPFEFAIERKG